MTGKETELPNPSGIGLPRVDRETKRYTDLQGRAWVTRKFLIDNFVVDYKQISKHLTVIPTLPGIATSRQRVTLFNEAEAERALLERGFERRKPMPQVAKDTRDYVDSEGNSWTTEKNLARGFGISQYRAGSLLKDARFIEGRGASGRKVRLYNRADFADFYKRFNDIPAQRKDWKTISELQKKFGRSSSRLRARLGEYRESHPEWFATVKTSKRKSVRETYSPELITRFKADLAKRQAPKGWQTHKSVAQELGATEQTVRRFAKRHKEAHPNWFGIYSGVKRPTEYLSPELIKELAREARERLNLEPAPEGWETMGSLRGKLRNEGLKGGGSDKALKDKIANYAKDHPESTHTYLNPGSHIAENYVSPELAVHIREGLKEITAPEGWHHAFDLAKKIAGDDPEKINLSHQRIERIARQLKKDHPEWFRRYIAKGGMMTHFSPEAVAEITKNLKLLESQKVSLGEPPEGWLNTNNLTRSLRENGIRVDFGTVKEEVEKIRNEHPEWFGVFTNWSLIYCSPEAIAEVKRRIELEKSREIPPGYWTQGRIEEEARLFVSQYGKITHPLLLKMGKSSLSTAINKKYPGGINALKEKFGLQAGISQNEARRDMQKLVEVRA